MYHVTNLKELDGGEPLYGRRRDAVEDAVGTEVKGETLHARLSAQRVPYVLVCAGRHVVYDPAVTFCCLDEKKKS